MRFAQPEDAAAIRRFDCGHRPWYVEETARVIRRAAALLGRPEAERHGVRVLLFEVDERIVAVSIFQRSSAQHTADLVALAVHESVQGARLDEKHARPLCVAVLEETTRYAAAEGYDRAVAMIADENERSLRLIEDAGFTRLDAVDHDYSLYQAALPSGTDAEPAP